MSLKEKNAVKEAADRLAAANTAEEENIKEVYWFPDDNIVRLIEVDASYPNYLPSEDQAAAFYFGPDDSIGMPLPSGVALINPEEVGRVKPPEGWGEWDQAVKIWPAGENDHEH